MAYNPQNPNGQNTMANSQSMTIASDQSIIPVLASNITNKFREAFETYTSGVKWTDSVNSNDIITIDGNTAASSYLVISKSPFTIGNSSIETINEWSMPFDMTVGLSLSQRTLGQEFSVELVSNETPLTTPSDLQISSIQQATTTLTITTTIAHNLRVGMRIGIRNCIDSRLNYSALVVATTPSSTQFTVTAGPGGNLPSVTAGPFTSGFVYFRSTLGFAPNGTSMIFENATATNASFYVCSERGDVLPSGTINGNHSVTIGTTVSTQAINAATSYSFQPTNEYKLSQFIDGIQWTDATVDTINASNNRLKKTQVVPDISPNYKFRIRSVNQPSLTRPIAKIVSVTKSGTTTATVITDVAHNLTTSDLIQTYGTRDQTNFANLTTATAIASIVNTTTFTVIWGGAVTATTYGGSVTRVNGGQLLQGFITNGNIQSISRTSNIVSIVTLVAVSGLFIGDYINIYGVRSAVNGSDLELDGAYRVRDIQTTTVFLEPIGSTPTGINISSTNCGGVIIRRTDIRITFVHVLDFERQRIEILPRPIGDISNAASVNVVNIPAVTVSGNLTTLTNLTNLHNGQSNHSAASRGYPVRIGGRVVPTTIATQELTLLADDACDVGITSGQQLIIKENSTSELDFTLPISSVGTVITVQPMVAASGTALVRNYIKAIRVSNDTLGTIGNLLILDSIVAVTSIAITTGLTTTGTHDLRIGDAIIFTALAAGTGVTVNQIYYVTTVASATTFNFSATPGGTNVIPSVAYTGTSMYRVFDQIRLQTTPNVQFFSYKQPLKGIANTVMNFLIPVSLTSGNVFLTINGYRGF